MARVNLIQPTAATGDVKNTLEHIQRTFGAIPAMFQAVANSSVALKSMWSSFGAVAGGTLPPVLKEQLAVAIADRNRCEYCLAAHTALGRKAGASAQDMSAAQAGTSADPRAAAAISFALKLVDARGEVSDDDVRAFEALEVFERDHERIGVGADDGEDEASFPVCGGDE